MILGGGEGKKEVALREERRRKRERRKGKEKKEKIEKNRKKEKNIEKVKKMIAITAQGEFEQNITQMDVWQCFQLYSNQISSETGTK